MAKPKIQMPIAIHKPQENLFFKGMIFGPPGAGKTHFLGSADDDPRTSPILILNYEGGMSSLVGRDTHVWDIGNWDDFNEAYSYLSEQDHPFKSVGIDSASEVHTLSLLLLLEGDDRKRRIPDLLEQGDYGIALTQMRKFLRTFRNLPMHVFASALSKEISDPYEGTVRVPALTGSLADEAPGIFDVVAYLAQTDLENEAGDEELHRVLLLQNYPKFRVKARTPWDVEIADEIIDPTVTNLLDTLQFPA